MDCVVCTIATGSLQATEEKPIGVKARQIGLSCLCSPLPVQSVGPERLEVAGDPLKGLGNVQHGSH